jgi:hypothetical protein
VALADRTASASSVAAVIALTFIFILSPVLAFSLLESAWISPYPFLNRSLGKPLRFHARKSTQSVCGFDELKLRLLLKVTCTHNALIKGNMRKTNDRLKPGCD